MKTTIDLVAGWWILMSGDEVIAQLDSEVVSSELAYKVFDLIDESYKE